MQDWIAATRPRTLAAAFAPLVLATGWLLAHEQFHVLPVGLAALAALCFQIGCNFVNDVADFERGADQDRVDGDKPQRAVASGRISSQAMWRAAGLMLGLGEDREEVIATLEALRSVDCQRITLGQYLRPSLAHLPVARYWTPEEFDDLAEVARELGFAKVRSGPLVRSSYHAAD